MYIVVGTIFGLATIVGSAVISLNTNIKTKLSISKKGYKIEEIEKAIIDGKIENDGKLGSILLFVPGINLMYVGLNRVIIKSDIMRILSNKQKNDLVLERKQINNANAKINLLQSGQYFTGNLIDNNQLKKTLKK